MGAKEINVADYDINHNKHLNKSELQKLLNLNNISNNNLRKDIKKLSKNSGYDTKDIKQLFEHYGIDANIVNREYHETRSYIVEESKQNSNALKLNVKESNVTKTVLNTESFLGNKGIEEKPYYSLIDGLKPEVKTLIENPTKLNSLYKKLSNIKGSFVDDSWYLLFNDLVYGEQAEENTKKIRNFIKKALVSNTNLDFSEITDIYAVVMSTVQNQEKAKKANNILLFDMAIDQNQDGKLDIGGKTAFGESLTDYMLKDDFIGKSNEKINNFIENILHMKANDFFNGMRKNYPKYVRLMKEGIEKAVQGKITPAIAFSKDGARKVMMKNIENNDRTTEIVGKQIDEKLTPFMNIVNKEGLNKMKGAILTNIFATLGGLGKGIGANWNINDWFDIQVGVSKLPNGMVVPALGVSKIFRADGNKDNYQTIPSMPLNGKTSENSTSLTVGTTIFPIPAQYLTLSSGNGATATVSTAGTLGISVGLQREIDNFKSANPTQIDGKISPTIYGFYSPLVTIGGVNFRADNSEKTFEGISKMKEKMSIINDSIIKLVLKGEKFNINKLKGIDKNISAEAIKGFEEIYSNIKKAIDYYLPTQQNKQKYGAKVGDILNRVYSQVYENALKHNASLDGWELDSIGAGVILIANFLPIPYISAGGHKISEEMREIMLDINSQKEITKKNIKPEYTTYNGHKVLKFPSNFKGAKLLISNPNGKTQAEYRGNSLYVSGDIKNYTIQQIGTNDSITYYLTINGGAFDENGSLYETTINSITSDIIGYTKTIKTKKKVYYGNLEKANAQPLKPGEEYLSLAKTEKILKEDIKGGEIYYGYETSTKIIDYVNGEKATAASVNSPFYENKTLGVTYTGEMEMKPRPEEDNELKDPDTEPDTGEDEELDPILEDDELPPVEEEDTPVEEPTTPVIQDDPIVEVPEGETNNVVIEGQETLPTREGEFLPDNQIYDEVDPNSPVTNSEQVVIDNADVAPISEVATVDGETTFDYTENGVTYHVEDGVTNIVETPTPVVPEVAPTVADAAASADVANTSTEISATANNVTSTTTSNGATIDTIDAPWEQY